MAKRHIEDPRHCLCGKNIGRGYVWRDDAGVDHIECEACATPPRFPYSRPRFGPYLGSIADADTPRQGDLFGAGQ